MAIDGKQGALADGGPIPIVDFAPFLDGSDKQAVADAVVSAMKKTGFVYLFNHGMPQDKIDGIFALVSARYIAVA